MSFIGHHTERQNGAGTALAATETDPMLERLLEPTYQNRLRVIGRHLDLNELRSINLMEVEGGILVRAFIAGTSRPELMEFPDDGFPDMMHEAMSTRGAGEHGFVRSPLLPTGYEDSLRAIGFQLDRRVAKMIAIVECRTLMFVSGMAYEETSIGSGYAHFDFVLSPEHVQTVLDAAFRRRKSGASSTAGSGH